MPPAALTQSMFVLVEDELRRAVTLAGGPALEPLRAMLAYHMGWEGEGAGPAAQGKRIRPLLVLLTCAAAGGTWEQALPAAAAVELVHNFSLIHDDIEDNSPLRRGRETVWKRWGIPQAINAGDAMFTLAHLWLLRLAQSTSAETALSAVQILQKTCLHLTQGQYLDISYEQRQDLQQADYWPMVGGKTAALLAACTELGALCAGAPAAQRQAYRQFGERLGLAFQVQDDLLGIWGSVEQTGKSAASDLVSGKKSLPVLFGLEQKGRFFQRWQQGPISIEQAPGVALMLEEEGGRLFAQQAADRLTAEALAALDEAQPQGQAGQALRDLSNRLLNRQS